MLNTTRQHYNLLDQIMSVTNYGHTVDCSLHIF